MAFITANILWELVPAAEEEGELLYQKTTYAYHRDDVGRNLM